MNPNITSKMPTQDETPLFTGPAVAATLSALLGFHTLMLTHHISRLTKGLDAYIHSYGYWIPGSQGSGPDGSIGSYSGKETLALVVWIGSWLFLHLLWKKQNLSLAGWVPVFLMGLLLASLGFIHPLADPIVITLAKLAGM
jgi:hypothetical protein